MCVNLYTKHYETKDAERILGSLGFKGVLKDSGVDYVLSDKSLSVRILDFGKKSIFHVEDDGQELWEVGKNSTHYSAFKNLVKRLGAVDIRNESCEKVYSELLKN